MKIRTNLYKISFLIAGFIIFIVIINQAVSNSNIFGTIRDSNRKKDLTKIQNALEEFYQINSRYPLTTEWETSINNKQNWISELDSNYIHDMPKDPLNSGCVDDPTLS